VSGSGGSDWLLSPPSHTGRNAGAVEVVPDVRPQAKNVFFPEQ